MEDDALRRVNNGDTPFRLVLRALEDKECDMEEILQGILAMYQAELKGNDRTSPSNKKNE